MIIFKSVSDHNILEESHLQTIPRPNLPSLVAAPIIKTIQFKPRLFSGSELTEFMYWASTELEGNELLLLHDMKQHLLWKGHLSGWKCRFVSGLINPKEREASLTPSEWGWSRVCVSVCFAGTSWMLYVCVCERKRVGVSKYKFKEIWSERR